MPSNWENCAHNGLICFFQHNYISTFEQWLWDRVCVLSTWFGDIWGSRRDFCTFYKRSRSLYFKFYSLRLLTPRPMQYRVPVKLHTEMHWQYWPSPLREAATNCAFWSTPCECRLPSLFSIMFLDTLYSKKWYDMPHIGCGIHSLQRSTISRIGRHPAGYNIVMRVVPYKL